MRLFLAIFPPKEYLDYFRDTLRKFNKERRNLKPIPIDQLHLTIKFVGPRVSEDSKDFLVEQFRIHQGNFGKIKLELQSIRFGFPFQHVKAKSVLMAKVKESDSLTNATKFSHGLIKEFKLLDTIYWKQKYAINHHISLARMKKTATKKTGKEIQKIAENLPKPTIPSIEISEMYFVESIIQNDGSPIYKRLEEISL